MAWTVAEIPDQRGRVALVTGGNSGLGLETARRLARAGARVIIAARSRNRAEGARDVIVRTAAAAAVEIQQLDLASLASVRACAEAVLDTTPRLDLLVNNAGVMGTPRQATEDGFELQFGVNHLGHFALTVHLLPALAAAPGARIVTVTSWAYLFGRGVDPDDPHLREGYGPWRSYIQSKLANLQFALELDRRLAAAGTQVSSLAAQPGLADTNLQAASVALSRGGASQRFFHVLARSVGMSPVQGARTLLRAATDPAARGGDVYEPRFLTSGPPVRRRPAPFYRRPSRLRTLWEVSERETGVGFDQAALVRGGHA